MVTHELTPPNLKLSHISLQNLALDPMESISTSEKSLFKQNQADIFESEGSETHNSRTQLPCPRVGLHIQMIASPSEINSQAIPDKSPKILETKLHNKTCSIYECDEKNRVEVGSHDNTEFYLQAPQLSSSPRGEYNLSSSKLVKIQLLHRVPTRYSANHLSF